MGDSAGEQARAPGYDHYRKFHIPSSFTRRRLAVGSIARNDARRRVELDLKTMIARPLSSHSFFGDLATLLIVSLLCAGPVSADALSDLPAAWLERLQPVAEADLSGAEPAMREAIAEARAEVAALLQSPESTPQALGRAYGRLGARLLLEEVETQADACLRNAMELDPNELRWPYYAGYMAMLAGNLDRALQYFERARQIDPEYPPLALRLGKVQLDRGDLDAAEQAFTAVVDRPQLRSPAHYYLGQVALLQRRFGDAVDQLQAALAANPEATEAHYPLARAYQALGREQEAKQHLERFVLRSPEVADPLLDELRAATQRALPAFERGIHAVRQGDYQTAVEQLAAGLELDPTNAAARVSYARVLFLTGHPEQARQALQQALADAEGQQTAAALAHFLIGVLDQAEGDQTKAAAAYRRALALEPGHAGALFQLANLDFAQGRYQAAAEGYAATLEADPDARPARLLGLIAQARTGVDERELAAALTMLREAAPEDMQLAYAQARLLASSTDAAIRDPEAAMTIAAELAAARPIPPHQRLLALADAATGRLERAADAVTSLIDGVGWMVPPEERALMAQELAAYQDGRMPPVVWAVTDPLLSPPPFDARRLMRDYPAARPY